MVRGLVGSQGQYEHALPVAGAAEGGGEGERQRGPPAVRPLELKGEGPQGTCPT